MRLMNFFPINSKSSINNNNNTTAIALTGHISILTDHSSDRLKTFKNRIDKQKDRLIDQPKD